MYCFECKISDIGLCFNCAVTKNFCLNCIAYGEGSYCQNCIRFHELDEAVDLHFDLEIIDDWVQRNNHFWRLKFLLSRLIILNHFNKK